MKRNLQFERVFPHPGEKVWHALTDPAALAEWLMPNDFKPVVGHHFQFKTKPAGPFDGIVHCEVLEVVPPERLVYSWKGGPLKEATTVTWTLKPVEAGTHLRLEHAGFVGIGGIAISVLLGSGWRGLLRKNLSTLLNTIQIQEEIT